MKSKKRRYSGLVLISFFVLQIQIIGSETFDVDERKMSEHRQVRNLPERILARMRTEFKDYEECMEKNNALSRKFYDNFIKGEIVMQGQTAKLSCVICTRPDQDVEAYNVRWYRRLPSSEQFHKVPTDDEKFVLMPDKTLLVRAATVEDGGQYTCFRGRAHIAAYMLDVLAGERYRPVVGPPDKGRRPAPPVPLPKHNLEITTTWSAWSRCSQCGKRGEHRRLGFCTLRKLSAEEQVKPREVGWLRQFQAGLPCRSNLLPDFVKALPEVQQRPSESMVAFCFMPCPTAPPVKVYTDATGQVLETVDVGDGFVSMKEGRPKLPPTVKRKMIYEKIGRRLLLQCPYDEVGDVAVRWQNGSQTLNALTIKRKTRGRVVINAAQALAIRRLRFSDTAAYSCWVEGEHIATIKVRVITKMKRDYKDYILFGGFGAVLLILLCIGCGVGCVQRKRALR